MNKCMIKPKRKVYCPLRKYHVDRLNTCSYCPHNKSICHSSTNISLRRMNRPIGQIHKD